LFGHVQMLLPSLQQLGGLASRGRSEDTPRFSDVLVDAKGRDTQFARYGSALKSAGDESQALLLARCQAAYMILKLNQIVSHKHYGNSADKSPTIRLRPWRSPREKEFHRASDSDGAATAARGAICSPGTLVDQSRLQDNL
jgi:hypothetical protein